MKVIVPASLLLLSIAAFARAEVLYSSNPIGMELGQITREEAAGREWVLAVSRDGSTESRVLYEEGKEKTRWVDTLAGGEVSEEKLYEGTSLSRVTTFQGGLPVRVEDYADGKPSRITLSQYSGGVLRREEVEDAEGKLLYRDEYTRGPNGRLRRVIRSYPDGREAVTALNYAGGRLVSEWLGNNGSGTLYRFGNGGSDAQESWKGTSLLERQTTTPKATGSEDVTRNFVSGSETTRHFDGKGRLVSQVETRNGQVVSTTDYSYEAGLLVSKSARSPGAREETRYFYSKEGKLERVDVSRNRSLVQVTHYTGANSYYEDFYTGGRPVIRVYFENGKKTKEEALAGASSSGAPAAGSPSPGSANGE